MQCMPNHFSPASMAKMSTLNNKTKLFGCIWLDNVHKFEFAVNSLRWLNTVSSTYIWMGRYNHSLSLDATIMVSKNCPIIDEHVVIIFLTL